MKGPPLIPLSLCIMRVLGRIARSFRRWLLFYNTLQRVRELFRGTRVTACPRRFRILVLF